MAATTTLKLPAKLKTRIERLAKMSGRSAHSFILEVLEYEVTHVERIHDLIQDALAGEDTVARGATGKAAARPKKPRRK